MYATNTVFPFVERDRLFDVRNDLIIEGNEAPFGALVVAATKQASNIETTGIFAKPRSSGSMGSPKEAAIKASEFDSSDASTAQIKAGSTML
jgi:hypothetical protein